MNIWVSILLIAAAFFMGIPIGYFIRDAEKQSPGDN